MSRYAGNHDPCPHCGLLYKYFGTGLTYSDVWLMMADHSEDSSEWKYKKRNTVLGKWFQVKQEMWKKHIRECGEQKEYETKRSRHWEEKGYPPEWDDIGEELL
jgi:hypothetical protein